MLEQKGISVDRSLWYLTASSFLVSIFCLSSRFTIIRNQLNEPQGKSVMNLFTHSHYWLLFLLLTVLFCLLAVAKTTLHQPDKLKNRRKK